MSLPHCDAAEHHIASLKFELSGKAGVNSENAPILTFKLSAFTKYPFNFYFTYIADSTSPHALSIQK